LPGFELGILDITHETIPPEIAARPGGAILTFVVDDLAEIHERALAMRAEILQPPTDLPYGQRRLMLRDPAGTAVDLSSPI
ncbi:MAG: VOC family protein, partial [Pseudomonadota bacterium]